MDKAMMRLLLVVFYWVSGYVWAANGVGLILVEPDSDYLINQTGFENFSAGQNYTEASWIADGFNPRWVDGFDQGRAYLDTTQSHFGKASLRIKYPANTVGSSDSGAQVPLQFTGKREVYISYWFKFDPQFDWGRLIQGGKLPGLGSGDNCSGGSICDGSNGFSARLMWREQGQAMLYLYHMDKPDDFGEYFPLKDGGGNNFHFSKDVWHHIVQRVKINSSDNADGEVQIWIDEAEVLNRDGLRFVNDGSLVDNFYFSTFHGGSDIDWAPRWNSYIWFDDIKIIAGNDDPGLDYSGLWWNPDQSGQGIQIVHSDGNVSGAWYLYDENGNGMWVTFIGTLHGTTLNTGLLQFTGPALGANWEENLVQGTMVGTVTIDFTSNTTATLNYTLNNASGSLNLQPFAP